MVADPLVSSGGLKNFDKLSTCLAGTQVTEMACETFVGLRDIFAHGLERWPKDRFLGCGHSTLDTFLPTRSRNLSETLISGSVETPGNSSALGIQFAALWFKPGCTKGFADNEASHTRWPSIMSRGGLIVRVWNSRNTHRVLKTSSLACSVSV